MRCKGPKLQKLFLSSRFYLTGRKSEIDRKIPRLPSRGFRVILVSKILKFCALTRFARGLVTAPVPRQDGDSVTPPARGAPQGSTSVNFVPKCHKMVNLAKIDKIENFEIFEI